MSVRASAPRPQLSVSASLPHRTMNRLRLPAPLAPLVLLAAPLAVPVAADTLVTTDGRVLECKKARETANGYALTFETGVIQVPKDQIAEVAIEGDMSDYVPANDDEQKKLEMGFVRYRGKWMSKPAYESELNKRNEERRERMEERALHTDFLNAWEKETKHFVIKTNTSPELLEYYGDLLETYYDLMDKRIGIKPSPTLRRTKMTVNIYKSHEEFVELSAAGVGMSTLGYFWSYDQTLNFFHDYQEPARSEWVALHECTHLLTYLVDPQFEPSEKSIWVNEGVADLFGSSDILIDDRGRIEIIPGKLQTDRVLTVQQAIKDGTDTTIEELLRLPRGKFDGFQYAHAWSFVYFLTESNAKYSRGFKSFFKDLYALKGVEKETGYGFDKSGVAYTVSVDEVRRLLLKKLGLKDFEELEEQWKEFVAAIPIEAPEARFKRAYRFVRYGQGITEEEGSYQKGREQALADLNFAIENGFDDPRAYWARGQLSAFGSGSDRAQSDFRKAIELDPLNPAYRFDLAQALCGRFFGFNLGSMMVTISFGGDDDDELRGSDEELAEARLHFGVARDLDPDNDFYAEVFDEYMSLYQAHRSE